MVARSLTLNLVPGGVLPRINVSQYDTGVPVTATLYDGDTPYIIPSGAQVYVQGRKHDGTLYQYQCGTSGSVVTFATTTQMTMVAGENIAEISIHYNGAIVGTINFIINVEESALQDPTQSSIDDIPVIADLPEIVARVEQDTSDAEAWAVGQRGGVDVPDTDETYHNNSKYYAGHADDVIAQIDADLIRVEASMHKAATSADLSAFYATSANRFMVSAQAAAVTATSASVAASGYASDAEESARLAAAWSENPPYIGANGNWWIYDVNEGEFVDSGIDASISLEIADITMLSPSATPTVTNSGTSTDAVFHLGIPRGLTGAGVTTVEKIASQGLIDTYRMTFSDNTHYDYTVTNGADGSGAVSSVNHIDPVGGNVQLNVTNLDATGSAGQLVGLTSTNTLGIVDAPNPVIAGTGLVKAADGKTLNHSNAVTAGTIGVKTSTEGISFTIPYADYDAQGHITGKGSRTHTIPDIPDYLSVADGKVCITYTTT